MCRFTNPVQLCPVQLKCSSFQVNLQARKTCRASVKSNEHLSTITETQEEELEDEILTARESQDTPNQSCSMESNNEITPEQKSFCFPNNKVIAENPAEQSEKCKQGFPLQEQNSFESKIAGKGCNNFEAFGDFFPADFLMSLNKGDMCTKNGIKNYIERHRIQAMRVRCREAQLRETSKSTSPEVQAWLHFFG